MVDARNKMILVVDGIETPMVQVVTSTPVQVVTVHQEVVTYETPEGDPIELPEVYEMRTAQ